MKNMKIIFMALFCLAAFFTGCSEESAGQAESAAASSAKAETPKTSAAETEAEESPKSAESFTYIQSDAEAEKGYDAILTLRSDQTFEFEVMMYDGTVTLGGIYDKKDSEYRMTVTENSAAEGTPASAVSDFKFTENSDGSLSYSGTQLGLTPDGTQFVAADDD